MPSAASSKAPVAGEPFALTVMERLNEHPTLRPLAERRVGLNQRLAALAIEASGLRRQQGSLPLDGAFGTSVQRRALEDRLHQLERAGGEVETELLHLSAEIERVEACVRHEVGTWRTLESITALQGFVDALEVLSVASVAFEDCCKTNYGLLQSWIVPKQVLDLSLPHRLQMARTSLEQLKQTVARLEDEDEPRP